MPRTKRGLGEELDGGASAGMDMMVSIGDPQGACVPSDNKGCGRLEQACGREPDDATSRARERGARWRASPTGAWKTTARREQRGGRPRMGKSQ
jgi:hypothetical protein